jgi:uncharacterized protein (TIGR01244 family)
VAPALTAADFPALALKGAIAVISNRPDGEAGAPLMARAEQALAWGAGLKFAHVPAPKLELFTDAVVEGMAGALAWFSTSSAMTRERPGLVVAHCASGIRSAIVWAAAEARLRPVDDVMAALKAAGFELDAIRDDLESQADRRRWLREPGPDQIARNFDVAALRTAS